LGGITWFETLGNPVVVTTNDPGIPTNMLAVFVLVIFGPSFTFKVRDCIAVPAVPASSFNVSVYWPPVPGAGVPPIDALLPLPTKDRPFGSVPDRPIVPMLAEIENEAAVPAVNTLVLGLVKIGALTTVTG
jgi:hypothetical protein